MDPQEARWIIECLPRDRTIFHYFKDRYAHEFLAKKAGRGVSIAQLKQGRANTLLQKPTIRPIVAAWGQGMVTASHLTNYWPTHDVLKLRLSLGLWGQLQNGRKRQSYAQTTRGGCSLVLLLNFSHDHDYLFNNYFNHQQKAYSIGNHIPTVKDTIR